MPNDLVAGATIDYSRRSPSAAEGEEDGDDTSRLVEEMERAQARADYLRGRLAARGEAP
jgi:hypothetical protein